MSDKILVEEKGNTIRVRFMDQILDGNAPELREILAEILEKNVQEIYLDLEKVVIVSSLGISRLLSFKNKADEKKMTVKIVNIQEKLKETLKKLMLDQFFGL
ncbi:MULTISPECIES: STAS domain-containing protein [Leptospira]|uniref:STAS domain-containing protein n=6 Tax=Leptospira TaxID=171 RepID=A0AAW5VI42_9LEPT|nr:MULTISPECIES: STAS domain-containing protein [Leptospira]EMY62503.1 STAS domain protein [Leptospira terpstrae serovar Hualin str. LT 11-33 = ATCC 700639]EOQ95229.1 STAS domain protein [Leptospira wolbachii serovar Codice str. CDC]MBM9548377.1 STAS domain-containing protein [Leptospira abararensis]MBM9590182.1 STAS domain-containing protein [Leptospira chreensis]MCW7491716.1 STAS domain-containing protein [Leptospira soteropolitanensis]